MKKIVLSLMAFIGLSSLGYAESVAAESTEESRNYKDEGLYVGISYTRPSYDVDASGGTTVTEMDFDGLSLQLGYKFNPYISVEGRYVMTFGDPTSYGILRPTDAEVTVWGIYAKPTYPLGPEFDVYALLGYAGTEVTTQLFDGYSDFAVDEGSFSWGVGGKYIITETISVYADYLVYYDDSTAVYDQVIDSINFGISYQF